MSAEQTFAEQVSTFTTSCILAPIVKWLQDSKGVAVTVEELQGCLKLTAPASSMMMPSMPVASSMLPSHLAGVAPVAPIAPKKGRAKAAPVPGAMTCQRIPVRGANTTVPCGKPATHVHEGVLVPLCKECSRRKGVEQVIEAYLASISDGTNRPLAPPMVQSPVAPLAPPVPQQRRIKATPIPGETDKFVDADNGFIIQKTPTNQFVVSMISPSKLATPGDLRPLTPEEEELARGLGLTVTSGSSIPSNPTIPAVAAGPSSIPVVSPIKNADQFSNSVPLSV